MKNLNWRKNDIREIGEKDLDAIDMKTIKKSKSEEPIKRKYGRIPNTENKMLNEIILNGIKNIDAIKDMNYEDCEYVLSSYNINEEISSYLKEIPFLIDEYEKNEEEKPIVIKCLSYFFDDKSVIESVRESIRYIILADILNCEAIEDKSFIIDYIKNNVDKEEIKEKILVPVQSDDEDEGFGGFEEYPTDDAGGDGSFSPFPSF